VAETADSGGYPRVAGTLFLRFPTHRAQDSRPRQVETCRVPRSGEEEQGTRSDDQLSGDGVLLRSRNRDAGLRDHHYRNDRETYDGVGEPDVQSTVGKAEHEGGDGQEA